MREYISFDLSDAKKKFMRHFEILDEERKSNLSYSVVSKFATLVNNNFTREQISSLIDSLLLNSTNLSSLLKNDDIFEETNITYALINKLASSYHQTFALEALIQIPIQCINKNVRVALINNLTCESFCLDSATRECLLHLLSSPTFKSNIETNFYELCEKTIMSPEMAISETGDEKKEIEDKISIFEKVWTNHLSQAKEPVSEKFLESGYDTVKQSISLSNGDSKLIIAGFTIAKFLKPDSKNFSLTGSFACDR